MKARFLFLLLTIVCRCAMGGETEVYSRLESLSFSEIAPIKQLLDDLKGAPVSDGDVAFTHNQFELGYRRGGWELGYFHRYDYVLNFNSDTARLVYLDKNDIPIEKREHFVVDLQPNHVRSKGLGLGYRFAPRPQVQAAIRLNYLQALEMTEGELSGEVEILDDGYRADLQLNYAYSRDALLGREEERVKGHGVSLDFDLRWPYGESATLQFSGRDAFSWIRYRQLTYTRAVATTNTISFDDDGTLRSVPALSGFEGYRNQIQRLPARYALLVRDHCHAALSCRSELFVFGSEAFARFGIEGQVRRLQWLLDYDVRARAVGLGLKGSVAELKLRSDAVKWEDAKTLELVASVSFVF